MRLKHLLIIAFVVVSAAPMFLGLQYLNSQFGQYTRQLFSENLSALSLIAKQRLLGAVDRIRDTTSLVASRTQLRHDMAEWNRTHDAAYAEDIARIILDARQGLTLLKEISVYDRQSNLVASTSSAPAPWRLEPDQVFKESIYLTQDGEDVIATSVAPLVFDHKVSGYIRLAFKTTFITELVQQRTGLGETGEWLFAVRHESGDALFAVPLKYDQKAAFRRRVAMDRLDVPITQAMLGNEIVMSFAPDYLERPVLASTRYLSELDWGLVAKINEEEVAALVNRNTKLIYIAELSIIVLAIFAGVGLSFFIAKPIEKLRAHTAKVTRGELAKPPEGGGWREVRELTEHFSVMIATLKEFNETLQSKIDERTHDLGEANRKLTELATRDPLTGLYNRRHLEVCLDHEIGRARRYGSALAIVIMDIDHFKAVNDAHGHGVGDLVLQRISEFLKSTLRKSDIVARIGGEEFCWILPETPEDAAVAFLDRVRIGISEIAFEADAVAFNVTCSFGLAELSDASPDADKLLKNADLALYEAKRAGRNRIVAFTQSPREV
ncbi:sensor domain-containing diguanylate cyclase [Nisaea denitrificans]|uniref:sensor domain-containing diguanylate cyclase n=1 Tax=Nisaea denitrificans TaxID=390877 RepID=UPI00040DC827|nr:diguanylate cyclase [Nisaea denitrificans]